MRTVQTRFNGLNDTILILAAHGQDKRKAEFLRVRCVQFRKPCKFFRRQSVQSRSLLLCRRQRANLQPGRQIRVCTQKRLYLAMLRIPCRIQHYTVQLGCGLKRDMLIGPFRHPRRMFKDPAEVRHKLFLAHTVNLFQGQK
ncbi:hypothetical protein D3C73_1008420 [compost metagenome]